MTSIGLLSVFNDAIGRVFGQGASWPRLLQFYTAMHRYLYGLFFICVLSSSFKVAGQPTPLFPLKQGKIEAVLNKDSSRLAVKKFRNYLYKKLYRWNGLQNYVSPPFSEWHLGNQTTHRNYYLSADINPHFFLFNDMKGSVAIDLTPRYIVRILRDSSYSPRDHQNATWDRSLPVRTPSYLPGGTVYFAFSNLNREKLEAFSVFESESDRYLPYRYYRFSLFHHSNGQDGRNDDPARPPNRNFNIYNGNFSVNLVTELGVTWGYWKKGGQTSLNELSATKMNVHNWDKIRSWFIGVEHVLIPGEPSLKCNCYSLAKLHLRGQWIDVAHYNDPQTLGIIPDSQYEKQRFIIDVSIGSSKYIGAGSGPWRLWPNVEFRYHAGFYQALRSSTTSAFIAAGYRSQDIYNIYLEDSYPFIQLGLVMGFKVHNDQREPFMDGWFVPAKQAKQSQQAKSQ
jgi:hypothetical protein